MIHEYRTYTLHPGKLENYVQLAETKVVPIRQDRYGRLLGFWYSEFGTLNQVHHIWEYASLDQRQAARKELVARRDWMNDFISGAWPTMQIQMARFMTPCIAYSTPAARHALYEMRTYRTVVGRFSQVAGAVAERQIAQRATRVGLWLSEVPEPNEVCELLAYPSFEDRLADVSQAPNQRAWLSKHASDLMRVSSTLLLPIGISPVQ